MIKRFLLPTIILAILTVGCNKSVKMATSSEVKKEISEEEAYQKFKSQDNNGKTFGETIDAKGAVAYDTVLPKIKKLQGADKLDNIKVTGTVQAVCKVTVLLLNN